MSNLNDNTNSKKAKLKYIIVLGETCVGPNFHIKCLVV
jgi:hypothetical protein